jgi:hypothetical protein
MTGPSLPDFTPLPRPADSSSTVPIDAAITQVVADPSRLGLTWQLRQASIVSLDPTITAQVDGDDKAVTVYSMIGPVFISQRVYVLTVPPGGNFIAGFVGPAPDVQIVTTNTGLSSVTVTPTPGAQAVHVGFTARANAGGSGLNNLFFEINGDNSAIYDYGTFALNWFTNASSLSHTENSTAGYAGDVSGSGSASGNFGHGEIIFPDWGGPHNNDVGWISESFAHEFGTTKVGQRISGRYRGNVPYNSITFFLSGSQVFASGGQFVVTSVMKP